MKLVIDLGNTLAKIAVFCKDEQVFFDIRKEMFLNQIESVFAKFPDITQSIISSVVHYDTAIDRFLEKHTQFLKLSHETEVPLKINYKTKDTLGLDRLCAAVAGNHLFPGENVLVIVAGTCITYNMVKADNEFTGGAISPGFDMRIRAMHHFTHKLPLVEKSNIVKLTGNNTEKSLQSGTYYGILSEIDGIISRYNSTFDNLKVILSGGDAKYFDKKLKNNIFAIPNIVLMGLNKILDFNAN